MVSAQSTVNIYRQFGNPGYTPAKRTRIENKKWYLVTLQNVETNPLCDYVGLADGQYTELLPGHKAREKREARLNHCNAIQEYKGPVYQLQAIQHGRASYYPEWATSEAAAAKAAAKLEAEYQEFREELQKELTKAEAEQAAGFAAWKQKFPKAGDDRREEMEKHWAWNVANVQRAIGNAEENPWRLEVTRLV